MKSSTTALFKYGLDDLIANVIPTFIDWTVDPTDAADTTDGDLSTVCTTGNKVAAGGYQYAYMVWDFGATYNILASMHGHTAATAGTPLLIIAFWDGSSWVNSIPNINYGTTHVVTGSSRCSRVALVLGSTAAATISPTVYDFHAWRLK